MVDRLRIQDGNPIWLSTSIVPSRDIIISPNSSPNLATIQVNSNDVFTYVKVENPGTIDLGDCTCNNVGTWTTAIPFQGFLDNPAGQVSDTQFGFTFTASPTGDVIGIPGSTPLLALVAPPSGRRAWAWSPDGKIFAYVATNNNTPFWYLYIVALQNLTRLDGTTLIPGHILTSQGQFAGPNPLQSWTNGNFGWASSKAVVAKGPAMGTGGDIDFRVVCPYAISLSGGTLSNYGGDVDWGFLVSPCGSAVALVPKILYPLGSRLPPAFDLITTANATRTQFRLNNVPLANLVSTGATPSINTVDHTAGGVSIDTGNGTIVSVDDPDCTLDGGGIVVRVDRVKASTLPTANLGVLPVGTAVLGVLRQNEFSWVQVPNQNGWANQSEKHWCLLAQAYTVLIAPTIPQAWNGQATNPPPFPIANENCAQRNIEISP